MRTSSTFSSPITVLGLFPVFFLVLLVLFVPVFSVFVFIFVFVRICKQRGKKLRNEVGRKLHASLVNLYMFPHPIPVFSVIQNL